MADAVRRVCGGAADTHAGNFASGTACVPAAHTLRAASPAHRSDYGRRCCYISGIVGWGFPHHGCDCGKPDRTQTVIRLEGAHARVPLFSPRACRLRRHTLRAEPASGVFMPPQVVFAGNGGWRQAAGSTAAKPSAAATARRSPPAARWWWPG